MEVRTLTRSKNIKGDPEKVKEMIRQKRKEHDKLVKGRFEFVDAQGGWIEFAYRFFPEDMLITYKFYHDEICEIPMGMVKHINNTVKKVRTFGNANGVLPDRGLPSRYHPEPNKIYSCRDVLMVTNVPYPQKAYINAITLGKTTTATFTSNHDFTVGEYIRFHIQKAFGTREINNKKGKVLSLESDSITVDIESTGWTPFDYSALNDPGTTPPHCVPLGSGKIPNSDPVMINIVDAFDNRRS